jgi:hypothetical protein
MRDARYVRLISWTLQSGSEQYLQTIKKNTTFLIAAGHGVTTGRYLEKTPADSTLFVIFSTLIGIRIQEAKLLMQIYADQDLDPNHETQHFCQKEILSTCLLI